MKSKKILFISWQAAMGHVTRDAAIARKLYRLQDQMPPFRGWAIHCQKNH